MLQDGTPAIIDAQPYRQPTPLALVCIASVDDTPALVFMKPLALATTPRPGPVSTVSISFPSDFILVWDAAVFFVETTAYRQSVPNPLIGKALQLDDVLVIQQSWAEPQIVDAQPYRQPTPLVSICVPPPSSEFATIQEFPNKVSQGTDRRRLPVVLSSRQDAQLENPIAWFSAMRVGLVSLWTRMQVPSVDAFQIETVLDARSAVLGAHVQHVSPTSVFIAPSLDSLLFFRENAPSLGMLKGASFVSAAPPLTIMPRDAGADLPNFAIVQAGWHSGVPPAYLVLLAWTGLTNLREVWIGATNVGLQWSSLTNQTLVWSEPMNTIVAWPGMTNRKILWEAGMTQYQKPVRLNTPQLVQYTFRDETQTIIDLTPYVSCSLELKLQGQAYSSTIAAIVAPATGGVVKCAGYIFTQPGIWNAQFVATDGGGHKLFGEPIEIRVVANVEDLALADLAKY